MRESSSTLVIQLSSMICLLRMLTQYNLTSCLQYRSQLIHLYLLKNLALLHGNSFQHGIKCLTMTTQFLLILNACLQNR